MVTGEHEVFDLALPALAVGDQFRDATKMMHWLVTRGLAGLDGPVDGREKVLPAGVAEGFLKVAGKPELQVGLLRMKLRQLIELALHFDDEVFVHGITLGSYTRCSALMIARKSGLSAVRRSRRLRMGGWGPLLLAF